MQALRVESHGAHYLISLHEVNEVRRVPADVAAVLARGHAESYAIIDGRLFKIECFRGVSPLPLVRGSRMVLVKGEDRAVVCQLVHGIASIAQVGEGRGVVDNIPHEFVSLGSSK